MCCGALGFTGHPRLRRAIGEVRGSSWVLSIVTSTPRVHTQDARASRKSEPTRADLRSRAAVVCSLSQSQNEVQDEVLLTKLVEKHAPMALQDLTNPGC